MIILYRCAGGDKILILYSSAKKNISQDSIVNERPFLVQEHKIYVFESHDNVLYIIYKISAVYNKNEYVSNNH